MVVLGVNRFGPFGVGTGDVAGRAVATDMVPARLSVVLDGKEAGFRPEFTVAKSLYDLAQG